MIPRKASIAVVLLFCVCGCTVGPNYKRPDLSVPGDYRGLPHGPGAQAASETFAEMKLAAVFPDEVLQSLLKEALVNNYDVRIAAAQVLQAGADLGITRANQLPTVNVAGGIQNQRMQPLSGNVTSGAVAVQASWILDFWQGSIAERPEAAPRKSAGHRIRARRSSINPNFLLWRTPIFNCAHSILNSTPRNAHWKQTRRL